MIKDNISTTLFILTNLNIILLMGFHIVACRLVSKRSGFKSPQMFLIKFVLFMNVPLFFGIILVARIELRSIIDLMSMLLFGTLVFNLVSYVYFHIFNMSETARRIKILLHLYKNGSSHIDELKYDYNPTNMVNLRLERLIEMDEITLDKYGRYHISSRTFIYVASFFKWVKNNIGLGPKESEMKI